jgi:uncharacterized caspase-like protein
LILPAALIGCGLGLGRDMIDRRQLLLSGLAGLLAPASSFAQGGGGGGGGGQGPGGNPGGPGGQDRIGDRAGDPRSGYQPQQSIEVPLQPQPPRIRAFVVSQSYQSTPAYSLANTTRDAALIGRSFQQLNLDAVSALVDAGPAQTTAGIASYLRTVDENTIAMVYVAGHGVEIGGENLLMLEGGTEFLSLQAFVQALRQRAGIAILFLDACRNNPLAGPLPADAQVARTLTRDGVRLQTSSVEELRARSGAQAGRIRPFVLQGSGIRIIFSTDPANVAYDGVSGSRNGPFAEALARFIRRPVSLDDIVSLTTGEVLRATRRRQAPWSQGSIDRPIYLSGPRRRLQSRLRA